MLWVCSRTRARAQSLCCAASTQTLSWVSEDVGEHACTRAHAHKPLSIVADDKIPLHTVDSVSQLTAGQDKALAKTKEALEKSKIMLSRCLLARRKVDQLISWVISWLVWRSQTQGPGARRHVINVSVVVRGQ